MLVDIHQDIVFKAEKVNGYYIIDGIKYRFSYAYPDKPYIQLLEVGLHE